MKHLPDCISWMMKKAAMLLLLLGLLPLSFGVASAEEIATYYFDESIVYLRAGEQTTLSVHCTDSSIDVSKLKILWRSSNESIVKVDNGKITTVTYGDATITASIVTADGSTIEKSCTVSVTNPTLTDEQSKVSIPVFGTSSLSISKINANEHVEWASADESIVTVDALGKITGVAPGNATVTATIGAGSDSITLTYTITVTSIVIKEKSPSVYMKKTIQLHLTTDVPDVIWTSSNKKVATVGKTTGLVKGKDAGTAKITVKAGNYKASVKITVKSKLVEQSHITAILKLVNRARKRNHKKPLEAEHHLTLAANARAKEISRKFSHLRPGGSAWYTILKKYKVSYASAGENIAYGQKTPARVMKSWMGSSGHKANILNGKYHKIGIGRYKKGSRFYWVQLFTD